MPFASQQEPKAATICLKIPINEHSLNSKMFYSLTANNIKQRWVDMSAGCTEKHIACGHTAISHLMSMGPCARWKRSHCCLIFHGGSRKILNILSLHFQTWRFPSVARSLCNNSNPTPPNSCHHRQPTNPSFKWHSSRSLNFAKLPSKKLFKYVCGLWPHFRGSILWLFAFSVEKTQQVDSLYEFMSPGHLQPFLLLPGCGSSLRLSLPAEEEAWGHAENKIRYSNRSMHSPTSLRGSQGHLSPFFLDIGIRQSMIDFVCMWVWACEWQTRASTYHNLCVIKYF